MAGDLGKRVDGIFKECIQLHRESLEGCRGPLLQAALAIAERVRRGGRIYLMGNGGSASDALHWAGELVGRFTRERPGIPAVALVDNPSVVTAVANDYGFDRVFARQLEALAGPADVVIAISTSGDSPNILAGLRTAAEKGCFRIGLSGQGGGAMRELLDVLLEAPSRRTPRIQEIHALLGHILCELVEETLFG